MSTRHATLAQTAAAEAELRSQWVLLKDTTLATEADLRVTRQRLSDAEAALASAGAEERETWTASLREDVSDPLCL